MSDSDERATAEETAEQLTEAPDDAMAAEGGLAASAPSLDAASPEAAPVDGAASSPKEDGFEREPAAALSPSAMEAAASFFTEGAAAVREMNEARKALSEARDALKQLETSIAEATEEVEHRRDVAGRYDEIVAAETAARDEATSRADASARAGAAIEGELEALHERQRQTKDADAKVEKRLKNALDAAEAREAADRDDLSRLTRALDEAKRARDQAEQEKKAGIATARQVVERAEAHLAELRDEYADLQRNPSVNPAAYSVRTGELQAEISDAAHELQVAKDDLPRITDRLSRALDAARLAVSEAEAPVSEAKARLRKTSSATEGARRALRDARDEADERQRTLKDEIADKEKERRAHKRSEDEARDAANAAQARIDEARDIYEHPEVTEIIASRIEADRAEHQEQLLEVDALARAESVVRERTRTSRARFIAAIAGLAIALILAIALVATVLG